MINCFWNAKLYEMVSVTVSMVHRFFEWAWWSIFGTNSAAFIGTTGADVDESRRDFRTGCNDWVIEFIRDCRFFGRLLRWPTARCSRWSTSVDRRRWSQRSRPSQARAAKRFASPRRSLEATRFVFSWFYKKLASGWVPLYGFLEQTRARARARVCMCVCVCVCVCVCGGLIDDRRAVARRRPFSTLQLAGLTWKATAAWRRGPAAENVAVATPSGADRDTCRSVALTRARPGLQSRESSGGATRNTVRGVSFSSSTSLFWGPFRVGQWPHLMQPRTGASSTTQSIRHDLSRSTW